MSHQDIAEVATHRHACKAFDPNKKLTSVQIESLKTVLRYSPSSVNTQPWHFIIAETAEGKARIAQSAQGTYVYNAAKINNASHVVALCRRSDLDEQYLQTLIEQEACDGRFPSDEAKANQSKARSYYVAHHRNQLHDLEFWMEKQIYIALGTLLQAAGAMGIDACPIEGFDRQVLDEVLGLKPQGLTSVLLVPLGYKSAEDFNAALPKSRLTEAQLFTQI